MWVNVGDVHILIESRFVIAFEESGDSLELALEVLQLQYWVSPHTVSVVTPFQADLS